MWIASIFWVRLILEFTWSLTIVKPEQGTVVDAGTCQPISSFGTEELIPIAIWLSVLFGNILARETFFTSGSAYPVTDWCAKAPDPSRGNSEGQSSLQSFLEVNWDLDWDYTTAQLLPLPNPFSCLPQLLIPRALPINILHANLHFRFGFPGNPTCDRLWSDHL